jgi:predicted nucleotidyltransferase
LQDSRVRPQFAILFGSVARGSKTPRDCDLLWIIEHPGEASEWRAITAQKVEIQKEFDRKWGLSLSITVMTIEEASEVTDFNATVFGGELIEILGSKEELASRIR